MIQATDLRLGNWVHSWDSPHLVTRLSYNKASVRSLYDGCILEESLDTLKGLPLTEEILIENCGFKFSHCNNYWNHFKNDRGIWIGVTLHSELADRITPGNFYLIQDHIKIEYLHDLQNYIYYNNGKKELEVKF